MKIAENQTVLLGPPGTGKTTRIISSIEEDLQIFSPEQIALVSFTKKAVAEARHRVCEKFGRKEHEFKYFQTIHSLCYRQLGANRNDLMSRENFSELGDVLGYVLTAYISQEDGALVLPDQDKGAKLLFLDNYARVKQISLRAAWKELDIGIPWSEVERFSSTYAKYKKRCGKLDFTDLLGKYIAEGAPLADVRVAYIDEGQDLSRLQWRVLAKCFEGVEKVVIAGDDDQSIFKWSGADLDCFLELGGEKKILAVSHRLPAKVHAKAVTITNRIRHRFKKEFKPREEIGTVSYVSSFDMARIDPNEPTLILVRNVYLLKKVYEHLSEKGYSFSGRDGFASIMTDHVKAIIFWESLRKGEALTLEQAKVVYEHLRVGDILSRGGKAKLNDVESVEHLFSWEVLNGLYGLKQMPIWHKALEGISEEKRQYYIGLLRKGVKLTSETKVHANTIHGVKGGEADHVIIISDMSRKTYEEMMKDPCSEHRVAYVAVTRAKKKLTIVLPQTKYAYTY